MLSGDLATYLSGRYVATKIFSLSYPEFLNFHNLKNTPDSFLKYVKCGGLPYLLNLQMEDNIVYDYLRNVYNTILLKDIVKRHRIRNVAFLEEVVEAVAAQKFFIWAVSTINDGIEILTGFSAGARGADGKFPVDTVNFRVEQRLREFWERLKEAGKEEKSKSEK